MKESGRQPGQEIEEEKSEAAHTVFHVVAENPEGPHVAGDMEHAPVQKHAREKRPVVIDRQSKSGRPLRVCKSRGDDAEQVDQRLEISGTQRELKEEDRDVGRD